MAKESAPAADPAAKLRKQVFIVFGAIIVVGLALAGWYVGFRVLAGAPTSRPTASVDMTPAPAPVVLAKPELTTAARSLLSPVEAKPTAAPVAAKPEPTIPAPPRPSPAETKPPSAPVVAKPVPVPVVAKPAATPAAPPRPSPVAAKPTAAPSAAMPTAVPVASPPIAKEVAARPETAQPAKPALPVKRKDSATPTVPFQRRDLNPHRGDRYLQVAAYGPRSLDAYLKSLEAQGLHPMVAPGPVENIYRILIGPFPNPTALEEARHSIQASGIEPILRSY